MVVPAVGKQGLTEEGWRVGVSPARHSAVIVAARVVNVKTPVRGTRPRPANAVVIQDFNIGAVGISEEHLVFRGKLVIEPQGRGVLVLIVGAQPIPIVVQQGIDVLKRRHGRNAIKIFGERALKVLRNLVVSGTSKNPISERLPLKR